MDPKTTDQKHVFPLFNKPNFKNLVNITLISTYKDMINIAINLLQKNTQAQYSLNKMNFLSEFFILVSTPSVSIHKILKNQDKRGMGTG